MEGKKENPATKLMFSKTTFKLYLAPFTLQNFTSHFGNFTQQLQELEGKKNPLLSSSLLLYHPSIKAKLKKTPPVERVFKRA